MARIGRELIAEKKSAILAAQAKKEGDADVSSVSMVGKDLLSLLSEYSFDLLLTKGNGLTNIIYTFSQSKHGCRSETESEAE